MKNKKSYLFIISLLMLGIFYFKSSKKDDSLTLSEKSSSEKASLKDRSSKLHEKKKNRVSANEDYKEKSATQKEEEKKSNRSVASIKRYQAKKEKNIPNYLKKNTVNQYNKNWKKLAQKKLEQNLTKDFSVELKHLEQRKIKSSSETKLVELVQVSVTHPSGVKSKYQAIVDSETGSIIDTFNPTHFEKRDFYAVKLSTKDAEFEDMPVTKDTDNEKSP